MEGCCDRTEYDDFIAAEAAPVDGCLADKFIVLVSAQGCSNKTPLGAPGLTTSNKKLLVPKIG